MIRRFSVVITCRAERDLRAIAAYYADHGAIDEAFALIDAIRAKIGSLEQFPERGAVPDEVRGLGIGDFHHAIVRPFRIFYLVSESAVSVVMIADARRDLQSLLQQRLIDQ